MTISKDLYLAILAMDAYNRGYGVGIGGLGGIGSTIGSTTILTDSETVAATKATAAAAGFYAVAYTMGSGPDVPPELQGKTIISYRGTDNYGALPNTADVWNGYGIALDSPLGEQARLAAAFRAAVAASGAAPILTGPSLGGTPTWH